MWQSDFNPTFGGVLSFGNVPYAISVLANKLVAIISIIRGRAISLTKVKQGFSTLKKMFHDWIYMTSMVGKPTFLGLAVNFQHSYNGETVEEQSYDHELSVES